MIDETKIIHTQVYDDKHEEWIDKEMTIADFLDSYTNEGCPIVQPERAEGKCRKAHEMFEDRLHCSCGIEWVITGHWNKYNYCPNCGARVKGGE